MKVSSLIGRLSELREMHGDLMCVTPGFDEGGYDDITTVDIIRIRLEVYGADSHCGRHDETEEKEGAHVVKAVLVNF